MIDVARIAIVDDDAGMRTAIDDLIRSLGYERCCYASALEFLAERNRVQVDCLILDIRMPGMSGLELQALLRREAVELPIIFLSSYAHGTLRARAMAAGARCVLTKPVNDASLIACLESALADDA